MHSLQCLSKIFCGECQRFLWNSTQNILLVHGMIYFYNIWILRALDARVHMHFERLSWPTSWVSGLIPPQIPGHQSQEAVYITAWKEGEVMEIWHGTLYQRELAVMTGLQGNIWWIISLKIESCHDANFCHYWGHYRLWLWQPGVSPVMTKLVSGELLVFNSDCKCGRPFHPARDPGCSPHLVAMTWKYKKLV